jgi:hypothetical protein
MGPDDAERLVDAMARARELLGMDIEPPSRELQSRVLCAAVDKRLEVTWKQGVDDEGQIGCWAIVDHPRGRIEERVVTTWEDAWRATGLLD